MYLLVQSSRIFSACWTRRSLLVLYLYAWSLLLYYCLSCILYMRNMLLRVLQLARRWNFLKTLWIHRSLRYPKWHCESVPVMTTVSDQYQTSWWRTKNGVWGQSVLLLSSSLLIPGSVTVRGGTGHNFTVCLSVPMYVNIFKEPIIEMDMAMDIFFVQMIIGHSVGHIHAMSVNK